MLSFITAFFKAEHTARTPSADTIAARDNAVTYFFQIILANTIYSIYNFKRHNIYGITSSQALTCQDLISTFLGQWAITLATL